MGISRGLVLALLLVVTGCAETDQKSSAARPTTTTSSPSVSPSASETASYTPDLSPPTQRELNRAFRRTFRVGSIDFGYDLLVDGSRVIELDGTWRRDPIGWASEAEYPGQTGEDDGIMRTTSVGKELWMQMAQWPRNQRKCWLPMKPGTVPVGINALVPGVPGPLRMLGLLKARPEGTEVLLAGAVSMLTVQVISAFGLDRYENDRRVTVPAYVLIIDEEVTDIRIKGADIVAALPTPLTAQQEKMLRLIDLELSYNSGGSSYDIHRPAAETVVLGEDGGCGS